MQIQKSATRTLPLKFTNDWFCVISSALLLCSAHWGVYQGCKHIQTMYHSVARVYIAQNVSKHQRRGRPRPWSLELFCLVFWGSRHWLKNNFAAFMHSLQTHLCKEQRFDTEKQQKIWSHPKFLEVTWRQMNSVRRVYKRIITGMYTSIHQLIRH